MQKSASQIILKPSPKAIKTSPKVANDNSKPTNTAEISSKETSPTLVEFQNAESQLPEWRLQLKNAVLKRRGETEPSLDTESKSSAITLASSNTSYPTEGGNALVAETIEENAPVNYSNNQLAKALERIEQSRRQFYIVEVDEESTNETVDSEKPAKEYPFTIAARTENPVIEDSPELKASVNFPTNTVPTLVPEPAVDEKQKALYDTCELDPEFISAKISSSFENRQKNSKKIEPQSETSKDIELEANEDEHTINTTNDTQISEIDDIAPLSHRFNAGLFDFIIGSFTSMILLSPFMLLGGNWFTLAGGFAFLATCSIVMFIYLTTTIGIFGKTFGMHLFTLEMIDYFEDEYPTFHQAAVSSSIYLLSLAVCGLGFVTTFFDEEKRAVHDLISGTIIVKEI